MRDDPAFLWETEALRRAPKRARPPRENPAAAPPAERSPEAGPVPATGDWATLREAAARTGIPRATVRNWARKGRIRSYAGDQPGSPRMVDLDDLRRHAADRGYRPEVPPVTVPTPSVPAVPEGSMIVPIDAWERILLQLGNLHEAGRELAEARERAARAETEASFLRERLAEFRDRPVATPAPPDAAPEVAPSSDPPPPPVAPPAGRSAATAGHLRTRARDVMDRFRDRRRR